MKYKLGRLIVMSLGGSVIVPDEIDVGFLKKFKKFVEKWSAKKKFVIVTGGGKIARYYKEAANKVRPLTNEEKDWLGIRVTQFNAYLVQAIFGKLADPRIIDKRHKIKKLKYPVTVACGWEPGSSTDFDTVASAEDFGASEIINVGQAAYVYDKDYKKYKDAKPFYELSWREYKKIIPREWVAGAHLPVDPVAARLAEKRGISVIIVSGDIKNLENLLAGREFRGTIIS